MAGKGILVVLSGPSGVGKNTVLNEIRRSLPLKYSISATTRPPRPGEVHGRDYFFLSRDEFEAKAAAGEFLEWAQIYGDYYGTPLSFVQQSLAMGHDIILDVDVQGAAGIRRRMPQSVLVFLFPPSFAELRRRLAARGTEDESKCLKRLQYVRQELACIKDYDYVVVNDELQSAVEQIARICVVEKQRVARVDIDEMLTAFYRECVKE